MGINESDFGEKSPPCLKEGDRRRRWEDSEGGGEMRPLPKGERAMKWRGDSIWIENITQI